MAVKTGSRKKSSRTRSGDAGDKDRLIAELKDRVTVLENELQLKHGGSSSLKVAESKQAEGLLRKSEERLDFSLRSADIGAWDLNLVDHTAWRSPRHDRIFGYEEPLPEWTYEMFLDHVLPEYREYVDSRFQEAVAGHGDWDFECRIRRVDGEVRWMYAHGRAVYDEQGQPLRIDRRNACIRQGYWIWC